MTSVGTQLGYAANVYYQHEPERRAGPILPLNVVKVSCYRTGTLGSLALRLPLFYDKYIVRMRNSLPSRGEVNAFSFKLIVNRALHSFKFMVSVRREFLYHALIICDGQKEG